MSYPQVILDGIPWLSWHEDPAVLADLIEFLEFRRPMSNEDILDLLRNPQAYSADMREMVACR